MNGPEGFKAIFGALVDTFRDKITLSIPITWTGYKNMKNLPVLLTACFDGINNPDFKPQFNADGSVKMTFCNLFVASVATRLGYTGLNSRLANDMIDFMSASPDWSTAPIDKAQSLANQGSLLVAGLKDEGHGHVCVLVPGIMPRSIHWSMNVPMIANVGKDVFIGRGLSFAFRELPTIYSWRASL